AIDVGAHDLVGLAAGGECGRGEEATRGRRVHEYGGGAVTEVRNDYILAACIGQVDHHNARRVGSGNRVLNSGLVRAGSGGDSQVDTGESRILVLALVDGGGHQQVRHTIAVHIGDRDGVRCVTHVAARTGAASRSHVVVIVMATA